TDAAGTNEVMNFSTQLSVNSLVSQVNQSDNKTLTQAFDTQNNLTCKQDPEGHVTTYIFNSSNQKTSETQGQSGSCSSPQTTAATRTTTYTYLSSTLSLPTQIQSP